MLNREEYSGIVNDIKHKWEKAEQLVIECDPKSIYALSEVDLLLEQNKKYQHIREMRVLLKDQEIIKKEFTDGCVCKNKPS